MSDEVSLTPDWRFFMASVAGFFALVLFSAMFISYIYNKNWDQDPSRRAVRYQAKQYKKVRRSDIKDVKALVSINSEASSFSFQQSGSSETFEAKAEQNAKKNKDQEQVQTLDLEEIEQLKEDLDKQVGEIRKLYSKDGTLDVGEDSDEEDDTDLNAQIAKLRKLIDQNNALLRGEEVQQSDEESVSETSSDGDDDQLLLKQKEEEKKAEEDEFNDNQQTAVVQQEEKINKERDQVSEQVLGEIADRSEEILKNNNLVDEEATRNMLAQIEEGCESMSRAMEDDKARQQELLKKRLEARRRKRGKLQDDLAKVDQKIEEREKEFQAKKDEVIDKHERVYQAKVGEYEKDFDKEQKTLDESLKEQKEEKLNAFEDRLQEADGNNPAQFQKALDDYQNAQAKVDRELGKSRQKQEDELKRRLKNRRNKAKADKDIDIHQQVKALEEEKEADLAEPRQARNQIAQMLDAQNPSKDKIKDKIRQKMVDVFTKQTAVAGPDSDLLDGTNPAHAEELAALEVKAKQEAAELAKKQEKILKDAQTQKDAELAQLAQETDQALEKAKAAAGTAAMAVQADLQNTQDIQKKVDELPKEDGPEDHSGASKDLLDSLKDAEAKLAAKLAEEAQKQQSSLADKLAKRKGRRAALNKEKSELKQNQAAEKIELEIKQKAEAKEVQTQADSDQFERGLDRMMMELTTDELPAAIIDALEDKHQKELEDLLKKLYGDRAKELGDATVALLEEKVQGQGGIGDDYKAKKAAHDALREALEKQNGGPLTGAAAKNLDDQRQKLENDEAKELQELEGDWARKKGAKERDLQEKALNREAKEVPALREAQLAERRRILDERLSDPEYADIKKLLQGLDDDEEDDLADFRKEQEDQAKEKLAEMAREQAEVEKALDEELRKLKEAQEREKKAGALKSESKSPTKHKKNKSSSKPHGAALKNRSKREIERMMANVGKEGQEGYDALTGAYAKEYQRQQDELEKRAEERRLRKIKEKEEKEIAREQEEEAERKSYAIKLENKRIAQERYDELRSKIHSSKRVTYKGGFSKSPLEDYNKPVDDSLEVLGNETKKRAQNAVQMEKLRQILDKVDDLDRRIKNDTRKLQYGVNGSVRDDQSDNRSMRSGRSRLPSSRKQLGIPGSLGKTFGR